MSCRIRSAEQADWERVRDIRLRSLAEVPAAYGSSYEREIAFTDGEWQKRLTMADTYLAIDQRGETVGTAAVLWTGDSDAYLVGMYVSPAARGTGCAHELIDAVVGAAQRRGASRVLLRVTEGNDPAARCYARYGFTPTGRRMAREVKPELTEFEYAYRLIDAPGAGARQSNTHRQFD